jgi:hypothetical protein
MLVGEENQGWADHHPANHERVMLGLAAGSRARDRVVGRPRPASWTVRDVVSCSGRHAVFRVNELLNWEVACAAVVGEISVGDASSSKVFAADQVQHMLDELTRVVHRYGDPSDEETGTLMEYLDGQKKRNLVLTFGGGVQEVQRELIAMFGLGLPRVPR